MPTTKSSRSNKKTKLVSKVSDEEVDEVVAPASKISKVVEVDIQDDVIGIVEEKPEADPLLAEEDVEDAASDIH